MKVVSSPLLAYQMTITVHDSWVISQIISSSRIMESNGVNFFMALATGCQALLRGLYY